ERADGALAGGAGALLDVKRLLDEIRSRRRLEDKREGAVFEDGDLNRDHQAGLGGRALVVLLDEAHDIDAVLAEGRADRRSRRCLAGLILELDDCADLLCHLSPKWAVGSRQWAVPFNRHCRLLTAHSRLRNSRDLEEVELDRRL